MNKLQILPPSNEDVFEDLCLDLWKKILNDPNAQRNGRRGQDQDGVDICGSYDGGSEYVGVQCKKKDIRSGKKLTEKEVRAEVEKAKNFLPTLSEYVIATTALRDKNIQKLAHVITEENRLKGFFPVYIYSWDEITDKLTDYSYIIRKYELVDIMDENLLNEEIKTNFTGVNTKLDELLSISTKTTLEVPDIYKSNFRYAEELLESWKPNEAFKFLKNMKFDVWDKAPDNVKYEILKLMGLSKHRMLQNSEAGKFLINAFDYNKEDERAKCNKAWGLLFLDKPKEAKAIAEEITKFNSDNKDAYQIIVYSSRDEEFEDIISTLPSSIIKSKEVAYALGIIARERSVLSESEKWLRVAIKNDQNDFNDLKANLGEVILERVLKNPLIVYTQQISFEEQKKLEEAKALLGNAWENLNSNEAKKSRLSWIVNKSTLKKVLNDFKGALEDIDIALNLDPTDQMAIIRKAIILSELGDYEEAKSVINKVNDEEFPEKPLILAQILLKNQECSRSVKILEKFLKGNVSTELSAEASNLLIQVYITNKDPEKAKKLHNQFYGTDTDNILGLTFASQISDLKGNKDKTNSFLDKAVSSFTEETSILNMSIFARELQRQERFQDASIVYEKFVDTDLYTNWTCDLVYCYYKSGEIGKAFNISKKLREIYNKPLKFIGEIEISICTEIDDLETAKELCDDYLKIFSTNIQMKINQALINLHLKDFYNVNKFLESPIDLNKLSLEEFQKLAYLYHFSGAEEEKYLNILYEMRRKYFDNYEAHAEYFKSLWVKKLNFKNNSNIELGMAVCLKTNSGEKKWFILEERKDTDIRLREINPNNPISKKLLGKSKGDTVNIGLNSLFIEEIIDKYVYAANESKEIAGYSENDLGYYPIELNNDEKTKFDPFFDILKEQNSHKLQAEKFYRDKLITIGSFSKLLRNNVIETWAGIVNNIDLNLKCCSNSDELHIKSLGDKRLIIDLISLLTIYETKVHNNVVKTFGKLGIAQSTIYEIVRVLNDQIMVKEKASLYTTVSSNNNVTVHEINPKDIETNIKNLEGLIEWIQKNCEVMPCKAALKINRNQRKKFNDFLGNSFMDTILIASEESNLLYSDDGPLRILAKQEFDVNGIWTQAVLEKCLKKNNIEKKDYDKSILKLVCFGYDITVYDDDTIMVAAEESKWVPMFPYTTIIDISTHENKEPKLSEIFIQLNLTDTILKNKEEINRKASLIKVLFGFISKLSKKPVSQEKQKFLTDYIINNIACRSDGHLIMKNLSFILVESIKIKFNSLDDS